ncbi:unnamed protein product, partial [Amoebophrya sp. A120]
SPCRPSGRVRARWPSPLRCHPVLVGRLEGHPELAERRGAILSLGRGCLWDFICSPDPCFCVRPDGGFVNYTGRPRPNLFLTSRECSGPSKCALWQNIIPAGLSIRTSMASALLVFFPDTERVNYRPPKPSCAVRVSMTECESYW